MFGHISTSYITESFLLFYHRYTRKEIEKSVSFLLTAFLSLAKEALIKSLSDFATSIMMQDKEKDDANSELFKESFDAALHNYAAK